jgi:regulator of sigma E protease
VVSYTDFVIALTECDLASPIPISINRAGESVETMLSFANSAQPQLGVVLLGKELELSPTEAVGAAVEQTIEMVKLQGTGMAMLISGQASTSGVSGPVGIFSIGTSAAGNGAGAFFHFLAVITVALGLFNLLPIPMLDGGHLVFSTFKIFTGKNVSARVQTAFIFAGLALLLTFVLLATLQDIGRLFGS